MAVVMKINHREISEIELMKEWNLVKDKMVEGGAVLDEKVEKATLEYAKQSIITRVLIEELVEKLDEEVDFKEIQTEYRNMLEHFGGKEKFFAQFAEENINEFKIKSNIEKSIQVNRVMDRWRKEGAALVSEEEIISQYEANQEQYSTPPGLLVMQISVPSGTVENPNIKQEAELKACFEKFIKDFNEPKFLEEVKKIKGIVVKEHVLVEEGFLSTEMSNLLNNYNDEQYSGLIKNSEGLHIFKRLKAVNRKVVDYEDARDQVKADLELQKQQKFIHEKIKELQSKANIVDNFKL